MANDLIRLSSLLDDAKCFDLIRRQRWPAGVRCPSCDSALVVRNGRDDNRPACQRWLCKGRASTT
jgi:transposase-like protein